MIKPDDIKKHTAEFFTSDPDFVLWCLDPERAQDGYWCGYTERHPQDLVEFERAVSLVRRVGKTHPALPSVEKQLLLDRILTDHYARCRFAAPPRRRNRAALFAAASLLVAGVVAALFWSADFTGSGLPSAEAYENITLVTREGSREVYDDIARISLTPKGEILIDGENIYARQTEVVELRKKVGMVFQKPNPFPKSIFENVAYGLRVNGIKDRALIAERVERSLQGAALWNEVKDKLKKSAFELSGGQQQRLCIARALAVEPSILLMDEPASALDPISTTKIEDLIYELKKEYTIVIVTHNMQQAARVSDRTAFFYLGELIEYDDTQKIFVSPAKEATQNYVTGRFG